MINLQFIWLIWSLLLLVIWTVVYLALKNQVSKREMLIVSLWTSLLGLTEPLFVPEYWHPPSLFDLARRTGFDIESLIFAFGVGGIATVIYEYIFRAAHQRIAPLERHLPQHRYHRLSLLSTPIVFLVLIVTTPLNPIYSAVIALVVGGLFSWYCRSDLKNKMMVSAVIFLGIYLIYFLTLIIAAPNYVEQVWNLPALSGVLMLGIPLEELLFAVSFGFLWSSIYEHIFWRKLKH